MTAAWRPIDTAPFGEDVLVFCPGADTEVMICHLIVDPDDPARGARDWYEQNIDLCPDPLEVEPTHWLPLPEPPRP